MWRLGGRWPVPIAALAFCVIAIPGVRRRLDLPTTDTFQDPITIACVLVVFAAAFADPLMRRLLSTRPAVFLGEVSFSFYLCHKMFILVAGDIVDESTLAGRMFGLAIAFGLTLGFAVLTHRLLETPSRTWLRGVLSARSEVRRA